VECRLSEDGEDNSRGQRHFFFDRANTELIWAIPRELLNIFQVDEIGYHVITVAKDILKKLSLVGW